MTEKRIKSKAGIAKLQNVASCLVLAEKLINRPAHLPGLGVFYGPPGYGKSWSAIFVQNVKNAVLIEAREEWTKKYFLIKLLAELGEANVRGDIPTLFDRVCENLGDDPNRLLIIDEADKIIDKGYLETIRGLHEQSQAPILLTGEDQLPIKIETSERAYDRVIGFVPAQPCDLDDTRLLAGHWANGLEIADDLLNEAHQKSDGVARRIVINIAEIVEEARTQGLQSIDLAHFKSGFFTGRPPRRGR